MEPISNVTWENASSVAASSDTYRNFKIELTVAFTLKFLLNFLGGFTNLALIFVCLYQKNSGSSGIKWLIIQYSLGYFLICFVLYPIRDAMILGNIFKLAVPLSQYCAHFATVNTVLLAMANWTDACLAVNRLVAICFPHQYDLMKKGKTIVGFLVFAWAISLLTIVPATYAWPGRNSTIISRQCSNIQSGAASKFLTAFESFISYGIVGLIVMVILLKAALMARKHRVTDLNVAETQLVRTHRRRMKVAFMLIAAFVWNCFCNFPFMILTQGFPALFAANPTLSVWSRLIRALQYVVSPLVFFVFSTEYRKTARDLVRRFRGRPPLSEETQMGTKVGGDTGNSTAKWRKDGNS